MTFRLSHLATLLAITILLAVASGAAATWWVADKQFRDVLDDDLEDQSKLLARLLASEEVATSEEGLQRLVRNLFEAVDQDELWVNVYDLETGHHVSNLPHDLPLASRDDGKVKRRLNGHGWRGFQEREEQVVVQLLRRDDRYEAVQGEVLEDIITPVLVGGGVTLLLLVMLILLFLRPVAQLARQLESRNANSLAPVVIKSPAREIRVLRDSLNNLITSVDSVLTRERKFASEVAHELRTPLTTLKIELAGAAPDLLASRAEVDRLCRVVEQLLTLARLEQGQLKLHFIDVDLLQLCRDSAQRFEPRLTAAGMNLSSSLSPAIVHGDETLLTLLVQNLLQNILVHCAAGTHVDLRLESREGRARLRISDTGPGIPEQTRRSMAKGFTRLDSKSDGFGLGLAICHRIATVHGAELRFAAREDASPGLVVDILFAG